MNQQVLDDKDIIHKCDWKKTSTFLHDNIDLVPCPFGPWLRRRRALVRRRFDVDLQKGAFVNGVIVKLCCVLVGG